MSSEIAAKYFNAQWYLETNGDVAQNSLDPYEHFITYGWSEGRSPTPFFNVNWYLDSNPDVRQQRKIPFQHYVDYGFAELRNPNPFFDLSWYKANYLKESGEGDDPLLHFITKGQFENFDPSPLFDTRWYRLVNPDLLEMKISPFEHFLRYGIHEGRPPNPNYVKGLPLDAAHIACHRNPNKLHEAALFITHSPDGRLKPHVTYHINTLIESKINVILIVATDGEFHDEDAAYSLGVSGLFVRQNIGFDFAAWAHVLQLCPQLYSADLLIMVNDSIIGPFNDSVMSQLIHNIRNSEDDVVGLVDSYEICWHIQSYFIAFKRGALRSLALKEFFGNVTCFISKQAVINTYEIRLAQKLVDAGLSCTVLFSTESGYSRNPHIYLWRSLIERGFPFIKVTTVRDDYPDLDISDWQTVVADLGYDSSLVDTIFGSDTTAGNTMPANFQRETAVELEDFCEYSYLTLNQDLQKIDGSAYEHYTQYGRFEGRAVHIPGLHPSDIKNIQKDSRETLLLVSHEGIRGGAPILVYNLFRQFSEKYKVLVLFQSGGPIADACREEGAHVIGPVMFSSSSEVADLIVNKIIEATQVKFTIVNSVASVGILKSLADKYIPTVTLIHEFASYIKPSTAFLDAALWSGIVIFSAEITRNDAIAKCAAISHGESYVLAQGICEPPLRSEYDQAYLRQEHQRIEETFDRATESNKRKIVAIGAGTVEYRKGVDLFIQCAAEIVKIDSNNEWSFVWVGRGFDPDFDVYSMFIIDQIRRLGLEDNIKFLGEVTDFRDVCRRSDLLLVTSRLDPLPNVALDALSYGVPTVCFDNSTGLAEIFKKLSVEDLCVAGYLDTLAMARNAVKIFDSDEGRQKLATIFRKAAVDNFNISDYANCLEVISSDVIVLNNQEREETEIILNSHLFNSSFSAMDRSDTKNLSKAVRTYIRTWKTGIGLRKPCPGFHPGIYDLYISDKRNRPDPFTHYIANGRPAGPWLNKVIIPSEELVAPSNPVSAALHIHCYYPDLLDAIVWRLKSNRSRPDLFVSIPDASYISEVKQKLNRSGCRIIKIGTVPNLGRDLGPFLTEFREEIIENYDLVGHIHTKKSIGVGNVDVGRRWFKFLLEHLIGGNFTTLDSIISNMASNPQIGLVFPDDPHIIEWGDNRIHAAELWEKMFSSALPESIIFPVGSMFWARTKALQPLLNLRFKYADFPNEPLPYDGTMLHAIERLIGPIVQECGYDIVTTHIPGIVR